MRFAALALTTLLAGSVALTGQEPTKNDLLRAVEKQLRAAHKTAGPSVACVVVSRSEKYPKPESDVPGVLGAFDLKQFLKDNPHAKPGSAKSLDLADPGSVLDHGFACGVVIDEKGLVLTPYHVIEGATKIYVHLPGLTGSYADIRAADARNDLAVLKLINPPENLKAIKFGDVRLNAARGKEPTVTGGKLVVLMANEFAPNFLLDKPSAALGSVTNVHGSLELPSPQNLVKSQSYYYHGPLLEHDAKLSADVSGAALLNLDGEMIGLTTTAPVLGSGDQPPAYALPTDDRFRRVLDVLSRGEEVEYGYLGVYLVTNKDNDQRFNRRIVQIQTVVPLGPSAQAGLLDGDIITHINGSRIQRYEELLTHISAALAGSKVTLTIQRGRNAVGDVSVTLGKLQHEQPFIASVRPAPVFGLRVDHSSLLAQQSGPANLQILAEGVPAGVSVGEVAPNTPAAVAFKKLGDNPKRWLITHVNGAAVATPREFYNAAKGQKSLKLAVIDPTEPRANRKTRELTLP